jgi:uncharacterized protein YuzE
VVKILLIKIYSFDIINSMKKNRFLYIILLILLTMCKKTPAVTVIPENNITTDEKVEDKVYIDINDDILSFEIKKEWYYIYVDLSEVFPELHIGDLYIYDKYVVIEEFFENKGKWYGNGFCVYEYNKNLKIMEYMTLGNKLYDAERPYWFREIDDDLLFIDVGSNVGIRGIHIFDLANKVEIFNASYLGSYSFYNNIIRGLVMPERDVRRGFYDDVKTEFYEYMQNTNMPKNDDGLYIEFIVKYNYNILTKEIQLISGEYIFEQ